MTKISEISGDEASATLSGVAGMGQFQHSIAAKVATQAGRGDIKPPPSMTESEHQQQEVVVAQEQQRQEAELLLPPGQQTVDAYGRGVTTQGGFFSNLMAAVKANPMLFAAGAVGLVAAIFFVPRMLKGMKVKSIEPVQTMGLSSGSTKKKRKKRKSKKTSQQA